MAQLRRFYARVVDSANAAVTSPTVTLLRVGALVTRDATASVAQVGVRHPGALVTNDVCYVLRNGAIIDGLTVTMADPSWTYDSGNGDWYMEYVAAGTSWTPTAGDRLVLTGNAASHKVSVYDNDLGAGTAGDPTVGSDGLVSGYVDAVDVDVKVTSGGTTTYITDMSTDRRDYVMPQEFGAIADGINDDTLAIQAAVDFVGGAGGGTVFFPSGTYKVTDTITVTEHGVTLAGENWYSSTLVFSMSTPGSSGIKVYNSTKRLDSCGIENLRLRGNTTADGLGYMIHLDGTRLCTIRHCNLWFSHAYDDGAAAIYIDATGTGSSSINRIESCEITVPSFKDGGARSVGYGIYFASTAGTKLNNGNQVSNVVIYGPASADNCPAIQIGSGTLAEQNNCSGHLFNNVRMDSSEGGGVVINTNSNRFNNLIIDGPSVDTLLTIGQYGSRAFFTGFSNNGLTSVSASLANGRQPFFFGPGLYQGPTMPTFVLEPRTTAPPSPVTGGFYYDSDTDEAFVYTGASWDALFTKVGGTLTGDIDMGGNDIVMSGTAKILSGTGTPEAAVTAGVGSLYLRTDGGASTTLYVKESGTGNTGWVAK